MLARSRLDTWEQLQGSAIAILPFAMLGVTVVLTVLLPPGHGPVVLDLLLAGFAGLWILWFYTLHPAWRERRRLMAVFFAGLLAVMAVMVIVDPWFGFFTFTGYFFVFT